MPETDAQKKELEQADAAEQVTAQNEATDNAGPTGTGPSTDAQKKEIQEN